MRASHLHRAPTGRGLNFPFGLLTVNQSRQVRDQRSQHTIMILLATLRKHKKML